MASTSSSVAQVATADPMSAVEAERFAVLLSHFLGGYGTRNRNLTAFVGGVLAAPAGPVRMPQIAKAVGCRPGVFRRLLDDVEINEAALRRALVATVPATELQALVIETSWVTIVSGDEGNGRQIFSLHAVGAEETVPIGWSAVHSPPSETQPEPLLSRLEAASIVELVSQAGRDYEAVEPGALSATGGRPVVLLDSWYGVEPDLRRALSRVVAEYWVAIHGDDVLPYPLRRESYESVDPRRSVAEYFNPLPKGKVALAREIMDGSDSRHGREYATAALRAGDETYAIVRPFVPAAPGALLGLRPQQRAAEIAALAASVEDTHAAERLRVSDFFHRDTQAVRRQALLASLFEAMRAGTLPQVAQ